MGQGKDPLLASVIMEDPLGNKAITAWQNTKYSCKNPTGLECAQQTTQETKGFCLVVLVLAIQALTCILI